MRTLTVVSLALLIAVADILAADIQELFPGAKLVSPDLLSGSTLVASKQGVAISAPSSAWNWFTIPVPESQAHLKSEFVAFQAETEEVIQLQVVNIAAPGLNDRSVSIILDGMLKKIPPETYKVTNLKYEASKTPAGSYKFSYSVVDQAGDSSPNQGVLISAGRLYVVSTAAVDLSQFNKVVGSFKVLKTADTQPPVSVGNVRPVEKHFSKIIIGALYLPVTILVLLICANIKNEQGVPRVNPGAAALFVLLVAVPLGILYSLDRTSTNPLHVSNTVSRHIGNSSISLIVAAIFWRRHRKQLQRARMVGAPSGEDRSQPRFSPPQPTSPPHEVPPSAATSPKEFAGTASEHPATPRVELSKRRYVRPVAVTLGLLVFSVVIIFSLRQPSVESGATLASVGALEIPPKPTAWVTDSAGIIDSAKEEALNRKIEFFKQSGGGEILVLTFPSLEGEELVDYTNRVADKWKIKGDRAVILFVFVRDRKTWIQVGYGLEGVITDSKASIIYRNVLVPHFRQGDYAGGIDQAVDQLITLAKRND